MSVQTLLKAQGLRQLMLQNTKCMRLLDASWHLPSENRNPKDEFLAHRIPGAKFFDIDECVDKSSPYEHTLPKTEDFSNYVRSLGINNDSHVVVYDHSKVGLFSAPRVWWMFRAFGHDRVSILDGGFLKWKAESDYPISSGPEDVVEIEDGGPFKATLNPGMFCDFDFVKANFSDPHIQVADARSPGRFLGTETEPRPNFPSGHIPHSKSLHYAKFLEPETKLMKDPEELKKVFDEAGIDLQNPLVTTCGSGITACIIALGAHLCGKRDTMVYDGSWVEWGQRASPDMIEKN
ncbi:3-mercaptopyruvate sulfurtransferase-like isoform X2 [Pocillopora verrucosa]|uniref:3-mercaptopyruvate sulfurtransferase-like isoform X2 n=1 Tax=Pocillopora verrucosa TaxID=203993 RepID=UPI0033421635